VSARNAAAFVSSVLALVACAGGASRAEPEPEPERPVCEVRFDAPAGFEPLARFEERYPDHIGVRLGFRDASGRELHAFAGIPGEFGEGLPDAGEVDVGGRSGRLFGRGRVWVLVWREGGICDPRAALGNGLERRAFLAALEEAGTEPA
jgi:hypothetical protein